MILKKYIPYLGLVAIVITFLMGIGGFWWYRSQDSLTPNIPGFKLDPPEATTTSKQYTNVLLIGTDERWGDDQTRSDTLMVLSLNNTNKNAYVLSLPRDSRVLVPNYGWRKINEAYAIGGSKLSKATVEQLLGITLDYYVKTDFAGFKKVVDTIGGVTLTVDKNMIHVDGDDPSLSINLRQGPQRLDGEKALQYVRFRGDILGDITRVQRQRKFLKAFLAEILKPGNLLKLPQLIPEMNRAIETDMTLSEMIGLVTVAQGWQDGIVTSETLPGDFKDIQGISYWEVNREVTRNNLSKWFGST